jgi:hypothetical protein
MYRPIYIYTKYALYGKKNLFKKCQVDIALLAETYEVVTLVAAENFSITLIPAENSSSCFFATRKDS